LPAEKNFVDSGEQNVVGNLMLAYSRKKAAADSYSMTLDVQDVLDIPGGESLTFGMLK
jgi:hypothetical protein